MLCDYALADEGQGGLGYWRVEAKVEPDNQDSLRVATRSGLRREGLRRVEPGFGDRPDTASHVVLARLKSDPPLSEPEAFRALLNSFLPRKRAIGQMLVRDPGGRVLLCQLTYKRDWDLPGGVVEVGESPRLAVGREIEEELGLSIKAGDLVLTDWLPPGAAGTTPSAWSSTVVCTTRRSSTTSCGRPARSCRRSSATSTRCASAAPTSRRAGSRPRWRASTRAARRTPSPAADPGPGRSSDPSP